jgi:hypothetical protein
LKARARDTVELFNDDRVNNNRRRMKIVMSKDGSSLTFTNAEGQLFHVHGELGADGKFTFKHMVRGGEHRAIGMNATINLTSADQQTFDTLRSTLQRGMDTLNRGRGEQRADLGNPVDTDQVAAPGGPRLGGGLSRA